MTDKLTAALDRLAKLDEAWLTPFGAVPRPLLDALPLLLDVARAAAEYRAVLDLSEALDMEEMHAVFADKAPAADLRDRQEAKAARWEAAEHALDAALAKLAEGTASADESTTPGGPAC